MNKFSSHYLGNFQMIQEVTVMTKNFNLEIVLGLKDIHNQLRRRKDGIRHTVFCVRLDDQHQYAIDLTGAQYGHHEECLPWKDYVTARVDQIVDVQPFGNTMVRIAQATLNLPYPESLVESMKNSFLAEIEVCIKIWEGLGESLNALLTLPEEQYVAKKMAFLGFVKNSLQSKREDNVRNGCWCLK